MDKIFLQKLSNMLDLASDMNKFGNHFIIDVESKNHTVKELNTFAHRIKQISNNVNDATKFFLTNNVRDFVTDNFVDICKMDKMKQEFRLPTDKPLLIQYSDLNRTIVINEISGFAYADYQVDFFVNYKDTKQIMINPFMSFVFSKNFFIELLDKFPQQIYLNFHKQDYADLVETTKEWRENRMHQIFELLMIYFSVINLSNDLDIFEEKKVAGLKKQPHQKFSLASFISKPVYEHITLDININNKNYTNNGDGSQNKKRLHGVRGHLRQLQNGKIVWVNPYKRGDASLGVITKDYKLDLR
jgi:hypothetical protein